MHSYPAGTRLTLPVATLATRVTVSRHTDYTLVNHHHIDLKWKASHHSAVLYLHM